MKDFANEHMHLKNHYELEKNLIDYSLRAPFFAPSDGLRFLDPEPSGDERQVDVETGDRTLQLHGPVRVENVGGRRVIAMTLRRTTAGLTWRACRSTSAAPTTACCASCGHSNNHRETTSRPCLQTASGSA